TPSPDPAAATATVHPRAAGRFTGATAKSESADPTTSVASTVTSTAASTTPATADPASRGPGRSTSARTVRVCRASTETRTSAGSSGRKPNATSSTESGTRLMTNHSTATTANSESNPLAVNTRAPRVTATRTRTTTMTGSAAAAAVHTSDLAPAGVRLAAGRMTRWRLTLPPQTPGPADTPLGTPRPPPSGDDGGRGGAAVIRTDHPDRSHGLEDLPGQGGRLGRRLADLDARGLQGLLLGLRGARGARDDGAGVAHGLALGGREAGDVADDRLGDVGLDVLGRTLLGVATDLADH